MPDDVATIHLGGQELTGAQTVLFGGGAMSASGADLLAKQLPASYDTYRELVAQPTIAFARALCASPIISSKWAVTSDDDVPDDRVRFIQDQILPIRHLLMRTAIPLGNIDYGWAPFEKVFQVGDWEGQRRILLKRVKPLLVDITDIKIDGDTGKFAGFCQMTPTGTNVDLPLAKSLLLNFRAEGDYHYGKPLIENARKQWLNWVIANKGAERYDEKMAGGQWVISYPVGEDEAKKIENRQIALKILSQLQASGHVAIPSDIDRAKTDLNQGLIHPAWNIELKEHAAKQASFIDRLRYDDTLFFRALLMPERAGLEGQYGTKAEAAVHTASALGIREIEHEDVTMQVQWHLVDQLLAMNFGEAARGTVRIEPAPLVDEKMAFYRLVYQQALANPLAGQALLDGTDWDAMMSALEIPKREEIAEQPADTLALQEMQQLRELMEPAQRDNGESATVGIAPDGTESRPRI